jgi:hypothetical protein
MKRSRSIAALFASLFVLHLMVVGGLAFAAQPSGDMSGMGMMQMASTAAADGMVVDAEAPVSDEGACPEEAPCDMPGMPGYCPSVASCAVGISSPLHAVAFDFSTPLESPVVASSQVPHTRTSPPELRPPRV